MPRALADGRTKFTILTTEPADPAAPTAAELNAGIDASCSVLSSDFAWGAVDSDVFSEKALCETNNSEALGAGNHTLGITVFREFDETTGAPDVTGDALFQALMEKGTEVWGYARKTGKLSTEDWAESDEIYLGGKVLTDTPQPPSDPQAGYQKMRVPLKPQRMYDFIEVAPAA